MRVVCWLLLIAGHMGFVTSLFLSGPADVGLDAAQYWELSGRCATGDFLWRDDPIGYRTPGYPVFLGGIRSIAGPRGWQAAVATQHLLLIVTAGVTAWIVHRLTGSQVWSMAAYVLAAGGLVRSWYAQTLLTETLFTMLLCVHFACLLVCLRRVTTGRCVAVGLSLAMLMLVRPVVQLWWVPAFGLIAAVGGGAPVTGRIKRCLIGWVAMGLIVIPWIGRNQVVFGEPFLTQFLGRNLWIVSFQDGAGADLPFPNTESANRLLAITKWTTDDPRLDDTWAVSRRLTTMGMADDNVDRLMRRVSLDATGSHPLRFGRSALRRLVNFWRCVVGPFPYFSPGQADTPSGQIGWSSAVLSRLERQLYRHVPQQYLRWNEFVACLVLVGAVVILIDPFMRPFAGALLLFFGMISVLTALVEIPNIRYRFVLEPLMVVTVCAGGHSLLSHWRFAPIGPRSQPPASGSSPRRHHD